MTGFVVFDVFQNQKFLWLIAQLTWQMDETDHICYCCKTTKIKQVCKNTRVKWAAVAVFGLTGWVAVSRQTWGQCWPWHLFVPPHEVTIQLLSILVYSKKLILRLVSLHFDVLAGNFWCWMQLPVSGTHRYILRALSDFCTFFYMKEKKTK